MDQLNFEQKSESETRPESEVISENIAISITERLRFLTGHQHLALVSRGDAAISASAALFDAILIPEEGGWLSYKKIPKHYELVRCHDSKIDLGNLKEKLQTDKFQAFLYQNPGGYFAEQPAREIYGLCSSYNCKVIIDVSGALGTRLCTGNYADIMVGSFGKWKLVDAGAGGFVSCKDKLIFERLKLTQAIDLKILPQLKERLDSLVPRINFLLSRRLKIIPDLKDLKIIHPGDQGLVVVVAFNNENEKERIINYCSKNSLQWTECPRYIRVNRPAISIEVKRL